jgi:hypothetical protein
VSVSEPYSPKKPITSPLLDDPGLLLDEPPPPEEEETAAPESEDGPVSPSPSLEQPNVNAKASEALAAIRKRLDVFIKILLI